MEACDEVDAAGNWVRLVRLWGLYGDEYSDFSDEEIDDDEDDVEERRKTPTKRKAVGRGENRTLNCSR